MASLLADDHVIRSSYIRNFTIGETLFEIDRLRLRVHCEHLVKKRAQILIEAASRRWRFKNILALNREGI